MAVEPHGEGTQPPIRAVQNALYAEPISIRERLGYAIPHYPLVDFYGPGGWFYDRLGQGLSQAAPQPHEPITFAGHRYVIENIVIGLALRVSLAQTAGWMRPSRAGSSRWPRRFCAATRRTRRGRRRGRA